MTNLIAPPLYSEFDSIVWKQWFQTIYTTYLNASTGGTITGNLIVTGYIKIGSSGPTQATKKLTVTTANTTGGSVTVAHGLNGAKIISYTACVFTASDTSYPMNYNYAAGYQFWVSHDGTNFTVGNHVTNSGNILSKTCIIYVTYEV